MHSAEIAAGETGVVFFEPDGLLLLLYLRVTAADRYANSLVLQMSYLGDGQITVDTDIVIAYGPREGGSVAPVTSRGEVALHGLEGGRRPVVWTEEVVVPGDGQLHWVVRGQSGPGRPLRGELHSVVTPCCRRIAVQTHAGATRE